MGLKFEPSEYNSYRLVLVFFGLKLLKYHKGVFGRIEVYRNYTVLFRKEYDIVGEKSSVYVKDYVCIWLYLIRRVSPSMSYVVKSLDKLVFWG